MMKKYEDCIIATPKRLFHLSYENQNGRLFRPRIPVTASDEEDHKKGRICFSPSIKGCYYAKTGERLQTTPEVMYVHVPENYEDLVVLKPTEKMVYDVKETKERWVITPVRMKCIGKIMIRDVKNKSILGWDTKYYWIEKY